jgi:hypothetical protein
MSTVEVALSTSQYVRVNIGLNTMILQAHRDSVRIVCSELQPIPANTAFHLLGGDRPPQTFPFNDTNVWALASSINSSLIASEFEDPKTASSGSGGDFFFEVTKGNVPGHTPVVIAAENRSVATEFEDISYQGGVLYPANSPETLQIRSTHNVDDAPGGVGALTAAVTSLDANFDVQVTLVTLNGTTPVVLGNTHLGSITVQLLTTGSNRTNTGDITVEVSGGGTIRTVMRTGVSLTKDGIYTVPEGKVLMGVQITPFFVKNNDGVFRTLFTREGVNGVSYSGAEIHLYQNALVIPVKLPFLIPARSTLKLQAKTNNEAGAEVDTLLEAILVDSDKVVTSTTLGFW